MPGCSHQIKYFDVYLYKNELHLLLLFLNTVKIFQTCYFEYFGHDWPYSPILIASTCRKVWLSACKISTSCLPYILRHCKDIAHLLFWVLWVCLAMATKNDGICFKQTFMLIFIQKIKFISHLFLAKVLQTCYFGYFRHAWPPTPKQRYLIVGNFLCLFTLPS